MTAPKNTHQSATVSLSGQAAEAVRKIMRATGWSVDESLAFIFSETVTSVPVGRSVTPGNRVGVQVVSNTITSYALSVGDIVKVTVPTEDEDEVLKLYGTVNGFAPQGIGVTLTDRSVQEADGYDIHVNKDDLWDLDSVTVL